jgi:hypothetical protein
MKASTVAELKDELKELPQGKLLELCLRLARFKKENKELLTYLLFEAHDEQAYIQSVKSWMREQFAEIPKGQGLYLVKKTLRKILRLTNKYIRYSSSKIVEIELLLHYCSLLHQSGIPIDRSPVLINLYQGQLKKIKKTLPTLHEDLQYDYSKALEVLV